ncbi:hypothetical protein KMW28_17520 [Flammeovirga yaeyamensis]|uniref:YhcG N-terminal domain-containing protein n=1 Tax=Flammeovirga yaeyamensis TaxID=367791 RepID=A0AAX1N1U0_9BACT|nr:sulfur relay (sulfurtransferase) DsrC/TusE family protein [Flammeovirga yaeyamensis]NMF34465.1 DUF1016 domain-containing protein [Flammeovirga yaeyamensis]QWG01444.1 hypothetical protein KMW28_17520 [Flammeovirga yaeyamensis]
MVEIEFQNNKWGAKVLEDISSKLQQEVSGLRGFSAENIKKMRRFFNKWNISPSIRSSLTTKLENKENAISSTLSNQLSEVDLKVFLSISFSKHFEILSIGDDKAKWYYIHKTAQNFWSVRHLRTEIKNQSHLQNETTQ